MQQEMPTTDILLTQCLMTFQTDYPMINEDLELRFDVQPMDIAGEPLGQVIQIALPNGCNQQYSVLIQAFMRASRTPFPPLDSYWAGDIVTGFGRGTTALIYGFGHGLGGLILEPYRGALENGFVGMSIGIFKGLGGFLLKPLRGSFDFIT